MTRTTILRSPETPPPGSQVVGIATPETCTNLPLTSKHVSSGIPEPPFVEPLTPARTEYDFVESVASYAHLQLLLDELADASSVFVSSEVARAFLISRPLPVRKQLCSVVEKLYHCCSKLRLDTQDGSEGILGSHFKYSSFQSTGKIGEHNDESDNEAGDHMESHGNLEAGSVDMTPSCSGSPNIATAEINLGYMESLAKSEHMAGSYQRLPAEFKHDWKAETDLASTRSEGISAKFDNEILSSDVAYGDNLVIPEQVDHMNCINSQVLEKPPHYPMPAGKTPHDSARQVQKAVITPGLQAEIRKELPNPKTEPSNAHDAVSEESSIDIVVQSTSEFVRESLAQDTWTSGAGWKSLVDAAFCGHQQGNIHYALAATALSRWHENQTQRQPLLPRKKAAGRVSKMIIGEEPDDNSAKEAWEQKRKTFNAHLTRGRKWSILAKEFGYGILFKNVCFVFDADVVSLIDGENWFNDDLILLCLHLADKPPWVRVGFSIPIHRQNCPTKMMARPFERAAKEIQRSRDAGTKGGRLVHFSPLLQHEDHFSLLEVNERDNYIYHYDPLPNGPRKDIKKALMQEKQFQGLKYIDKGTPRQVDGFSCGPLVVAIARGRMLEQSLTPKDINQYEALELRIDALDLIEKAWHSGIICVAEETGRGQKRKMEQDEADDRSRKRVHVEKFGGICGSDLTRVVIDLDE
ncbi:hypothetical protein F4809DRAFT_640983 [Biscogniauxia mediterranea]|nr:hypothetical protein F4809DRAFT_640983 [Biscogniauxia mediterranea]